MFRKDWLLAGPGVVLIAAGGCGGGSGAAAGPAATREILVTSEAGQRMAVMENVAFEARPPRGTSIRVFPDSLRQTIDGIGTSFTESSAFVLAHLEPARRREVMERIYGRSGADVTLARTHIGACDFSVKGRYSYADRPGDTELADFSVAPDEEGFDPERYPGVRDASYDLLPMIREALDIKRGNGSDGLRIIASAWTAPPWMKDIGTWFIPGSPENGWRGTGGVLEPRHFPTYAAYLVKFLDAYRDAGVPIWGLTPVNEPHGNNGNWESMHFTPESQRDFVRDHLGPRLAEGGHRDIRLLVFDQNRDRMEEWAHAILGDPEAASHVYGVAVHWYASTVRVFEEVFERVHAAYPGFALLHTEGCIDDLGKDAPGGVRDPEGYKESGWFGNDAFWWNPNATDWAYTADWEGVVAEDHPRYTPVHRYARDIIVGIDHWLTGWVDWNIVLDSRGGPNHVGNFCGAPIMIDTESGEIHYTPVYHVLAQFSRTIRPGDRAVRTRRALAGLGDDALHACATRNGDGLISVQVLNTTREPIEYDLGIGETTARITIPANAVQTVRVIP